MNIFEIASREDYRFNSVVGLLSVSDLWKLPLTSINDHKPNLNGIAININKSLKEFTEESFVEEITTSKQKQKQMKEIQLEIVKHIIKTKQEERKLVQEASEKASKKQAIMGLIAQKKNEQLSQASVEELEAMLNNL